MSCLRGSSKLGEIPSIYSNMTIRRAFIAWRHSKRHNTLNSVCEFYHRLEKIEESLPEEYRAASRTFEMKYYSYDPNPCVYFEKLFELDRINKLQLSQDPADHLELFKNIPFLSEESIDPEAFEGYRMPAFVELTRRFAAEQALLRASHEARVAAANSRRAGASAQPSKMHLGNGYLQGETQRAQRTTQSAVSAESITQASQPSMYTQGAGSYAQTSDSTLDDNVPQKTYRVITQPILFTCRRVLKYCRSHKISLKHFLDDFKEFVERGALRYSVANLDFYIKQRLTEEELLMVDSYSNYYASLGLDEEEEIELERQRVSAFFAKRRAMKNYTVQIKPTQNGDAENNAANVDTEYGRMNFTRQGWIDENESYAEVSNRSLA